MAELVCKLTDDDLNFRYDAFKRIFNKLELRQVPIAIYSISGPTRSGKSYLLNVFYHLLYPLREGENRPKKLPDVFKSTRQVEPETDGIYMTTEPLYRNTPNNKVAVFLMDTQGIDAGDKIKTKEAYLFAISSTLSFMQILNVLTWYTKLAIKERERKPLMVVVRDWENPDQYPDGYEGGKGYLKGLKKKEDFSRQVFCLDRNYSTIECFLLPHPGRNVARKNTKLISDIDEETWQGMTTLQRLMFSQEKLQRAHKKPPYARELMALAKNMQQALEGTKVDPPNVSFKDFFDFEMKKNVEDCFTHYKKQTESFWKEGSMQMTPKTATEKAKKMLLEDSLGDVDKYLAQLHYKIDMFEWTNGLRKMEDKISEWTNSMKEMATFRNPHLQETYFEAGRRYRNELDDQIQNKQSRDTIFETFKRRLADKYKEETTRLKRNSLTAACIAGVAVGVTGGASLAAVPAFLTFAEASTVATSLVVAGGAVGMGASGGAVGGGVAAAATIAHQPDDKAPDINLNTENETTDDDVIFEIEGEIRP